MIPILTRQWSFPTNLQLMGKDGLATFKGVKTLRDTLADHIEKVGTVLTEYHTVDTLSNRPPAGLLGRHFYATDTQLLYEDIGSTWVPIGGPGQPFFTPLSITSTTGLASNTNYFVAANAAGGVVNIDLPAATGSGVAITGKKMDSSGNAVNLVPNGADTIDNSNSPVAITSQYTPTTTVFDFAAGQWLIWS